MTWLRSGGVIEMCGIAGFRSGLENDAHVAARLQSRLAGRGPDGAWFQQLDGWGLVQTRLAVVDLSPTVTYPMTNESGDLALLFNGEIYRHDLLRAELRARGHTFKTACDAEVIVHAYEEWGHDAFARLDGMFALALVDVRRHALILTRDALGIKPLVYASAHNFAFASDAMALVAGGLSAGEPDREAVQALLAFGYVPPPATGMRDLRQLEPGTSLTVDARGSTVNARWRTRPFATSPRKQVTTHDLGAALDRSVAAQLVADVPVGVFLSSGLDSSLILESAIRAGARPTAFTVGFRGHGDFDERRRAARLAGALGVQHVWRDLDLTFDEALSSVVHAYDVPFADASAVAMVALAEMARQEVTVALSGTGGDDLFAGYYRHRAHLLRPVTRRVPAAVLRRLARHRGSVGAERRSALSLWRSYANRLAAQSLEDPWTQYLSLVSSHSGDQALGLLHADPGRAGPRPGRAPPPPASTLLRQIQAFELGSYLPGDLLTKEDRATMAVGLESRVPMLSNEMLSLAENALDSDKIGLRAGKRPLRELDRSRLPCFNTSGRKRGFAVPLADYFGGSWRRPAVEWLTGVNSCLLDSGSAATLLSSGGLNAVETWTLCVLTGWENRLERERVNAQRIAVRG
jgi:asparagine synthase (glutamine-hydrolysing)